MIDVVRIVWGVLTAWLDRREREAVAYLVDENRVLCHNAIDVPPTGCDISCALSSTPVVFHDSIDVLVKGPKRA